MESAFNYWLVDDLDLQVFVADAVLLDPAWRFQDYKCEFWRLYLNEQDGASLDLLCDTYPLCAGRIHILPTGLTFGARCDGEVAHFFVHFKVSGLPEVALRTIFCHPVCLPPSPSLETNARQISAALRAQKPEPPNWRQPNLHGRHSVSVPTQWRLKALLYESLAQCLIHAPPEQQEQGWQFAADVEPLVPALRWIEERLSERLPNADLARLCGISEDHFIRKFRQRLGRTPARYILERRVTAAAQRLQFTRETLDQIAGETGFHDRAHLSRAFRAVQGMAPAAYRKQPRV